MNQHVRGPHGHGRHRARRGAVGRSILTLLDERPMNGYELINEFDQRSGGRWKPSSGAIYPALQRLEQRGDITSTDDGGKPRYEITETGRAHLAERQDEHGDFVPPWEGGGMGRHTEVRAALAELVGPTRQIGRFGSASQIDAAAAVLKQATASLYRILADGPGDESDESGEPDGTDADAT